MGVPVGSKVHNEAFVQRKLEKYALGTEALHYFTKHGQAAMLIYCLAAQPSHLVRAMDHGMADTHYTIFDNNNIKALMDTMELPYQAGTAEEDDDEDDDLESDTDDAQEDAQDVALRDTVYQISGLPLALSGIALQLASNPYGRTKAIASTRDTVLRWVTRHAPWLAKGLEERFTNTRLPIKPTADYVADDSKDQYARHLKGHILGNIPTDSIITTTIPGNPNLTQEATANKQRHDDYKIAADLALHTKALTQLRNSEQKYNKHIAAHCLSSSCVNSGHHARSIPTKHNHTSDDKYLQMLRLRLGAPTVYPLKQWTCDCQPGQQPPNRREFEGHPQEHTGVKFVEHPHHALYCPKRHHRTCKRHDNIQARLQALLNRIPGVDATPEPAVGNGQNRADIKVTKNGTAWLLDIGITCPATASNVNINHSDIIPGVAAKQYHALKLRKYSKLGLDPNTIVPFIIETGGRLHDVARDFVDDIVGDDHASRRQIFKAISDSLHHQQAYMMATWAKEIRQGHR